MTTQTPPIGMASMKNVESIARLTRFSVPPKLQPMSLFRNTVGILVSMLESFAGCLTGPNHSGVQLHGFLSYLVKVTMAQETYTVLGYKGKQVRDNIHSFDVVRAAEEFFRNPRPGEVYNIGGGRENSISILEAFDLIEQTTEKKIRWEYRDEPRKGDHICYISDVGKLRRDLPAWKLTMDLRSIVEEIVEAERRLQRV